MAQYGRPASDITSGGWAPSTGSDLFAVIDESTPADGDYIEGGSTDTDAEVKLSSVDDPTSSSGHVISWRGQDVGGGGAPERIDVGLYQGGSLIVEPWGNFATPSSFTTYEYTLTALEADAISDYSDLRIRFTVAALASGELLQVSWAELEVPDATAPDRTIDKSDGLTLGESATVTLDDQVVSESDGITIADSPTVSVQDATPRTIDETDGITVGESVTASLDDLVISESDGITIAGVVDNISVEGGEQPDRNITGATDDIAIGENVTSTLDDLVLSVSDGLTVGESTNVQKELEAIPIDLGVDNMSVWVQGVVIYD